MDPRLPLSLFALAVTSVMLPAQGRKYSPPLAEKNEGNGNSFFPFVYNKTRVQHLIDGDSFTRGGGVIIDFAYRRDGQNTSTFTGRSIPSWIIKFGYSTKSPGTMSRTFASNRSGTQTTVFSGSYNLPTLPPTTGLPPWSVTWKLAKPYVYVRSKGNLLIEFEAPGVANVKFNYLLDAHASQKAPLAKTFGTGGPFSGGDAYSVDNGGKAPFIGGTLALAAKGLKKAYPALAAYGFSNTGYGGLNLPFDLTPLGAPKNNLYVSLDLIFPVPLTQQASGLFAGVAALPVPASVAFRGLKAYGQFLFLHPASNRLGLVFSNAVDFTIGEIEASQILGAGNSAATSGFFLSSTGRVMGPVIRFGGGL